MLIDFDSVLDVQKVTKIATVVAPRTIVRVVPNQSRQDLIQDMGTPGWDGLRDYVVNQIESRFGGFPRDAVKEKAIFSSFLTRFGDRAMPIARSAFEVHEGMWMGAPIGVNRFCRGSDKYFANPIAERLSTETAW